MDQLRSLRIYVEVVAAGSFAGAARTLNIAPPIVTKAVSELETALGARLLNRTTRRLALTDIGERYVQRARQILADLDEADAMVTESHQAPSGTVRVLCPPAFAAHELVKYLPAFYQQFPAVQLAVTTRPTVTTLNDQFDLSIISLPQPLTKGEFIARPLGKATFVLCASPGYLARHGTPATPADLQRHNGLLPAVNAVRKELTLYRQSAILQELPESQEPTTVPIPTQQALLATGHLDLLFNAAVAGLGITGLPSFMAQGALADGRLQPVLPEWHAGALHLYAAIPTRQFVPANTRAFLDFLVAIYQDAQEDPWLPY
ncbi:LysR family transcriptional regulator [Salinispirillum sp. LH 10-3-1]|uniref:LysR family transcriptional regulator n=1 Tax=Salinispirillum sp. LH 10-3-1 TaxID=2952525 RepID=A0AB38YH66_9GAMM